MNRRIPLYTGIAVIGLVGALYGSLASLLLGHARSMEDTIAQQRLKQVSQSFQSELTQMDPLVRGWSIWDEAYHFVQKPNAQFLKTELTPATLADSGIDLIVFTNTRNHQVVWHQQRLAAGPTVANSGSNPGSKSAQFGPIAPEMLADLATLCDPNAEVKTGFYRIADRLYMLACAPIRDSKLKASSGGALLVGRHIDGVILDRLRETLELPVDLYVGNSSIPPEVDRLTLQQQGFQLSAQSDRELLVYGLLRDIQGKPGSVIGVTLDRVIYRQGWISVRYAGLMGLGLVLIFGAIAWRLLYLIQAYLTDRKDIEHRLLQEKKLAQTTLKSLAEGVITTDAFGQISAINPIAEKLLGWTHDDAQGLPCEDVFRVIDENTLRTVDHHLDRVLSEGLEIVSGRERKVLISRSGEDFAIDDSIAPIRDDNGDIFGAVIVFRNVTQARQMEQQLTWNASHDTLTGLLNRREFDFQLQQAMLDAHTHHHHHCLLFIDLDCFKVVNDSCGHLAGDQLLCQISTLLQSGVLKTGGTVARLGGDEFGILLSNISLTAAQTLAQNLCDRVQEMRFFWKDQVFTIGTSIGLASISEHNHSLEELLSAADAACYTAKRQGRGRVHIYQADDQEISQQRNELQWIARIQKALTENRFCLYYQTIATLTGDHPNSEHYEVLLRMLDEDGNLVPPSAFIGAAERYNLMPALDRWVIQSLFATQAEHYRQVWDLCQREGGECLYTINLSGNTLNDDQFIHFVKAQLEYYQIPTQAICFEVTETVAIGNLQKAADFMQELRQIGCKFALDDFGTGMSSFAYLKTLPIDYLKIDGCFVREIDRDPIAKAMVEAINKVGQVMGIKTITEFVSSDVIRKTVTEMGVDYGQGYNIAEPRVLVRFDPELPETFRRFSDSDLTQIQATIAAR
jgi:diguanylate cyclase (GGDEF)-like protein/PAS domain S-box-containing protein